MYIKIEKLPAPPGALSSGVPTRLAHARPKTTMSSSELAPRRLAPWTDAHAASPAAIRPGTMTSGLLPTGFTTSPW